MIVMLSAGVAVGESVDIGQQVKIDVSAAGAIIGVKAGDKDVATSQPGGFSVVEILPPDGKTTAPEAISGKLTPDGQKQGQWRFEGRAEKSQLGINATLASDGESLLATGELLNLDSARDRAIQLDFVIPIKCDGWTYESGIETVEKIVGDKDYPADRYRWLDFGDPSKHDLVRTSMLWFNSVCDGQVGLAIGVAPNSPAAFRIGRDRRGLFIRLHLGLTAATEKFPNKATFKLAIFGIDGRWGIRSAAEKFYRLFPASFVRRADNLKFGSCAGTGEIFTGNLPSKQDFGITFGENDFQWTDGKFPSGQSELVKQLGLTCFHWREPWSYFLTGSDVKKTAAEELQLLKDQADGKVEGKTHGQMCGAPLAEAAKGVLNSYMLDSKGEMLRVRFSFGCRFIAVNLDPDLPRPNRASLAADYQYRWVSRWADPKFDGPRGIAWDSCTPWTGIHYFNYRREHFKTADLPLTYDPRDGRVCQMKALADRKFAVWHSKLVHDAGGLTMGNMSLESLLFFGDCVDVGIFESAADKQFRWPERMGQIRLTMCQKPFSFYGKMAVAGLRHGLLYGLAPGGDCQHEEYRPIARKYMPAIQTLAKAGWQPMTHARGSNCYVERFGTDKGPTYLAVANRSEKEPAEVKLTVDCRALKLDADNVKIVELIERRQPRKSVEGGNLTLQFKLEADESLAFKLE
jgi:hypothetical protein